MDANALFARAVSAIQDQKNDEARQLLAQVVQLNPQHEYAWLALASVLTDMAQARECLQRVLALNPHNSTAQSWLAFVEEELARQAAQAELQAEPMEPEILVMEPGDENRPVPRLGKFLLDYKFITEEQLIAALRTQRQLAQSGQAKRLGDILLEQGAITEERLNFALREQQLGFASLFND